MKMAKASQADLDGAIELYQFLQAASSGRCPSEVVDEFGYAGYSDLLERNATDIEFVLRAHERGGLFRVVWGMQVLLDPANEIVDPELPHLDHHPKRKLAQGELEELNRANNALIDERDAAIREREEYRAVVARQIEDKRRLAAERDEARQHHENALAIAAFEQLPKGPTHGRFTDAERQELEALKKKAFEAAKTDGGAS